MENAVVYLFSCIFEAKPESQEFESLIYCLNQLTVNLEQDFVSDFLNDCLAQVRNYHSKNDQKLLIILRIMQYFYHNASVDFTDFIHETLELIVPLLFIKKKAFYDVLSELLKSLLTIQDKEISFSVFETLVSNISTCLENRTDITKIYCFNFEDGLLPYIPILINNIVYGLSENCEDGLDFYLILLDKTSQEFIIPHTLKLVGPLIRIANYRYDIHIKIKLLEIFDKIHSIKLPIKQFLPQIQSTYIKLLGEYPKDKEFVQIALKNMMYLMQISPRKDFILNECFNKFSDNPANSSYIEFMAKALEKFEKSISKALIENITIQVSNLEIEFKRNLSDSSKVFIGKFIGIGLKSLKNDKAKKIFEKKINSLSEEFKDKDEEDEVSASKASNSVEILGILSCGYKNDVIVENFPNIGSSFLKYFASIEKKEILEKILKTILKINKKENNVKDIFSADDLAKSLKKWEEDGVINDLINSFKE